MWPTAVQTATLAVAVYAGGGVTYAAIVTSRFNRNEGARRRTFEETEARHQREFHEAQAAQAREFERLEAVRSRELDRAEKDRDRVTDRYATLLDRVADLERSVALDVVPTYSTTPVGDWTAAWSSLSKKHAAVIDSAMGAFLVRRKQPMLDALLAILDIDVMVLVPFARDHGMPPPARARMETEHAHLLTCEMLLLEAMRIDLGLADGPGEPDEGDLLRKLSDLPGQQQRSPSASADAPAIVALLRAYGVVPLNNADAEYRVEEETLAPYKEGQPFLQAPLGGLLLIEGEELYLCVVDNLTRLDRESVLRGVLRYIESGLRDGPPQRDWLAGARIVTWLRDGAAH